LTWTSGMRAMISVSSGLRSLIDLSQTVATRIAAADHRGAHPGLRQRRTARRGPGQPAPAHAHPSVASTGNPAVVCGTSQRKASAPLPGAGAAVGRTVLMLSCVRSAKSSSVACRCR